MDIAAENFGSVALGKVSAEEAGGRLQMQQGIAAAESLIQAPFSPYSDFSAVDKSPSPVQLDPKHSLACHIPVTPAVNAPLTTADARLPEEMSVTMVEGPTTVSTTAAVSSAPSSLPNDITGSVVSPSSSALLDFSPAAPTAGIELMGPSIPSSHLGTTPACSPSLTSSVANGTSTLCSSTHVIQAADGTTLSASGECSESVGSTLLRHAPQPPAEIPSSGVLGLTTSGPLLATLPTPLRPAKAPLAPSEISSSQAADIAGIEVAPSQPTIAPEKQYQQRPTTDFPPSPSPTDNNANAVQTSTTQLRSPESQPGAPCSPIEEVPTSGLPSPPESNLEMSHCGAPLPSPDVREADPVAVTQVGTSSELLSEHQHTSARASTSFPPSASKINALKRQRTVAEDTDAPGERKRSKMDCKAGNPDCGLETGRSILLAGHVVLACDICCTEPGFCRECKCILCCKTIEPDFGESTFVRCLRKPSGNSMCGHAAHLECALHSKMAGVVKKRGLDMEYLCRRCDQKTDLRELVTLLLEAVGNTEVRTQAERSLELALDVMNGTERGGSGARVLEALVQTALRKVKSGGDIQEAFKELKDQGAAAEAARQQNLVRSSCLMEDASQQTEASLDQWLPSSGSPPSHPSPGTPSFTSPRLKSNPSVTSAHINGDTQTVDGSLRKHKTVEGHTDHAGEPQISNEVISNSKYRNTHLGNKSLVRNTGQARRSHGSRAVSSNPSNNGLEAICESFTTRTPGNVAEPGSWDGNSSQRLNQLANSGTKTLHKDQRNLSSGAGKLKEENEMYKPVGSKLRHHTTNAVEITSTLKTAKVEDGGKRVLKMSSSPREDELDDYNAYKQVVGSDTGVDGNGRSNKTFTANGSGPKSTATALQMLDRQCEQEMRVALQKLRRAQEAEFQRAEVCLTAKRKFVLKKFELLEAARREFSEQPVSLSLEEFDELLTRTGNQFAGAREERDNFKIMLKVADGFGSVPKDDLKKFYRWPPEKGS